MPALTRCKVSSLCAVLALSSALSSCSRSFSLAVEAAADGSTSTDEADAAPPELALSCAGGRQVLSVGPGLGGSSEVHSAAFDGTRSALTWVGSMGRSISVGSLTEPLGITVLSAGLSVLRPTLSPHADWMAWNNHDVCGKWNVFEAPLQVLEPQAQFALDCDQVSVGGEDMDPQTLHVDGVTATFFRSEDRLAWRMTTDAGRQTGWVVREPPNPVVRRVVHDGTDFLALVERDDRFEIDVVTPSGEHLDVPIRFEATTADVLGRTGALELFSAQLNEISHYSLTPTEPLDAVQPLSIPAPSEVRLLRVAAFEQRIGLLVRGAQGELHFGYFEPGLEPMWRRVTEPGAIVPAERGVAVAGTDRGFDLYWVESEPEERVVALRSCL